MPRNASRSGAFRVGSQPVSSCSDEHQPLRSCLSHHLDCEFLCLPASRFGDVQIGVSFERLEISPLDPREVYGIFERSVFLPECVEGEQQVPGLDLGEPSPVCHAFHVHGKPPVVSKDSIIHEYEEFARMRETRPETRKAHLGPCEAFTNHVCSSGSRIYSLGRRGWRFAHRCISSESPGSGSGRFGACPVCSLRRKVATAFFPRSSTSGVISGKPRTDPSTATTIKWSLRSVVCNVRR